MAIVHANEENFDALVGEGVVLVDFWASWCGPCRMMGNVLEELEGELPSVTIVKVNVDENPKLAERFNISAIPDLYFYKDGEVVSHSLGAVPADEIREKLDGIL